MASLFDPFTIKSVTLRNRIGVSPMCQYSAKDGFPTEWHRVHYTTLARGGAGLVVVEATGVSPEGRITPGCTGIWSDAHAESFRPIVEGIVAMGAVPGIQLAHAGRKASANRPWEGDDHMPEDHPESWTPIAPSAIAFGKHLNRVPRAMTKADIERVRQDFVDAAKRAHHVGFKWLNLHFAHGYLGQNFLSTHSNRREDEYGGSAENRGRFLVETLAAVRKVWPEDLPLTVRLGVTEFDGRDEETISEAIELTRRFKAEGLDMIDVSFGFSTYENRIPWGPAFLVPFADQIKRGAGLPTSTTWNISTPELANRAIQESVDLVMLGRTFLQNPHWPHVAATALGRGRDPSEWILPAPYAHWLQRYGVAEIN